MRLAENANKSPAEVKREITLSEEKMERTSHTNNVSAIFYFLFLVCKIESNSQIPLPNHQVILSCKTVVPCGFFFNLLFKRFFY